MFSLTGRVALVTGSGRGVGAEIARTFARQGARIVVNDIDDDRSRHVVEEINAAGGMAVAARADVTDPESVREMVRVTAALGAVDILVNNAGIPADGMNKMLFVDSSPSDWEPFVRLNLIGVMCCTHAMLRPMIERGFGRVITVISDAARVGERHQAAYAASKAGAAGFMRSLAKEVARDGVTANCISLGSIAPPGPQKDPEFVARQLRHYPVGRLGTPADVAGAAVWLASDEASWVTGQTVSVDGGYAPS